MEKIDLIKQYKTCYTAKTTPVIVDIGKAQYLSVTGKGDPSGAGFSVSVQALYATAYAVKFIAKAMNRDFIVPKLEGLWWFDEKRFGRYSIAEAPVKVPRSEWEYRLLIRLPDFITTEMVAKAIEAVVIKKQLAGAEHIELFIMEEGKCVQVLHTGPFAKEPETLELLHEFMRAHGLSRNGLHHEIYLSDFRKTSPGKLKTIIREPVQ